MPTHQQVTQDLVQLRAEGSEASLDEASKIEREFEKQLAKESDETITAKGYDPKDLRSAHKSGRSSSSSSSSKSSSSSSSSKSKKE